MHSGLKETVCHVEARKDFTLRHVCQDLTDAGYRETICYGVCIELAVVVYPSGESGGVRLWDDECSAASWSRRWAYVASLQMLLEQCVPCFFPFAGTRVVSGIYELGRVF